MMADNRPQCFAGCILVPGNGGRVRVVDVKGF
jgi:hypothetical protein